MSAISPALHSLLSDVLAEAPALPRNPDAQQRLNHNRAVQQLIMEHVWTAAEEKWPGLTEFFGQLAAKERDLFTEAGPQA